MTGPSYEDFGDLRIEIWNLSYEIHTTTPDRIVLAGGSYLGEDGWCMIGYPGCDYLYFQLDEGGNRTYLFSKMENDCSPGTELFLSDMVNTLMEQGLLELTDLDGETLAKIMWPQSAWFLNNLAERAGKERNEVLLFLAGYLSNGGGSGKTYYENFVRELDGGYRAGELTAGGRAAWEKLKDFVRSFDQNRWLPEEEQIPGLPLRELLEFLSKSDGAFTESAVTELHQRFLADPAAVLSALAEREAWDELKGYLFQAADSVPADELNLCENPAVDGVAGRYSALSRQDDIPFFCQLDLPPELPVSEMDVCVVLQNLLENALEASRNAEGQRYIRLRASIHGDNLVLLIVENPYSGQLIERDGVFQSTKRTGVGVGLQSVAHIAEKNGGYCRFLYGNGVFTANVMLRGPGI